MTMSKIEKDIQERLIWIFATVIIILIEASS